MQKGSKVIPNSEIAGNSKLIERVSQLVATDKDATTAKVDKLAPSPSTFAIVSFGSEEGNVALGRCLAHAGMQKGSNVFSSSKITGDSDILQGIQGLSLTPAAPKETW